jgi:hypothetical protein
VEERIFDPDDCQRGRIVFRRWSMNEQIGIIMHYRILLVAKEVAQGNIKVKTQPSYWKESDRNQALKWQRYVRDQGRKQVRKLRNGSRGTVTLEDKTRLWKHGTAVAFTCRTPRHSTHSWHVVMSPGGSGNS